MKTLVESILGDRGAVLKKTSAAVWSHKLFAAVLELARTHGCPEPNEMNQILKNFEKCESLGVIKRIDGDVVNLDMPIVNTIIIDNTRYSDLLIEVLYKPNGKDRYDKVEIWMTYDGVDVNSRYQLTNKEILYKLDCYKNRNNNNIISYNIPMEIIKPVIEYK